MILQAINDLDGRTSLTPNSAKDSAREWFASESNLVGSFIWTCQLINLDPSFIRSQLAKKLRINNPVEVMPSMAEGAKLLRRKDSRLRDNVDRAQGRPPGTGILSFGLVAIAIRIHTATKSENVSFHLLHNKCGSRIRNQHYCPVYNVVVEREDLVRG